MAEAICPLGPTSFGRTRTKKVLTCTLHSERIGQDFSFQYPANRRTPVIAQAPRHVNREVEYG